MPCSVAVSRSAPVDRWARAGSAEAWAHEARSARRSDSVNIGVFRGLRRLGRPVTPSHSGLHERTNLDPRMGGATRRRPPRLTSTATFITIRLLLTTHSGRIADRPSSSGQGTRPQRLVCLGSGAARPPRFPSRRKRRWTTRRCRSRRACSSTRSRRPTLLACSPTPLRLDFFGSNNVDVYIVLNLVRLYSHAY
jgi:hypothetical protein